MKKPDGIDKSHKATAEYFDYLAPKLSYWKDKNRYYHQTLENLCQFLIPKQSSVFEIGSATGDLLNSLYPKSGVGLDISSVMLSIARSKYPELKWIQGEVDGNDFPIKEKFDYIVISDVWGFVNDVEKSFRNLFQVSNYNTRIVITFHNFLWEPVLKLAETLGLKTRQPIQNWLSNQDVENMLYLAGFEVLKKGNKMIFPVWVPLLSRFMNKILGNLPLISKLGIIQYIVARPQPKEFREYSVSIIIPARNERGNIENAIKRIPDFGSSQEIIFIEGHSTDGTLEEIEKVAE